MGAAAFGDLGGAGEAGACAEAAFARPRASAAMRARESVRCMMGVIFLLFLGRQAPVDGFDELVRGPGTGIGTVLAAVALRRIGRFHITWQDDNTLKVESDNGMQTRLLHFGDWKPAAGSAPTWQGDSRASWEMAGTRVGGGSNSEAVASPGGSMKVVTTRLRPGYLRKNGLPFGANALLTEFWDVNKETNGDQWMVITTLVDDPDYLQEQWVTALHFRKEPNGAKWDPTPCSSQ